MAFPVSGRIAELLRHSTVHVRSGGRAEHSGSGVVLNHGRVLTNAHVVGRGEIGIEAWDGIRKTATVTKIDRRRDLALLETAGLDARAAELSDSPVASGQTVIAVGNPLGFIGAVSTGVVHAVGRLRGLGDTRWVQADIRLAPGNSGGPLDIHGRVLGVNTMIVSGGLALAIPAGAVQAFLSARAPRELGVALRPVRFERDGRRRSGLLILEVNENSAAMRASLLPGDLIVGANGADMTAPDELHGLLESADRLELRFLRGGHSGERRVVVQLAAAPLTSAA
jgi:serine protease Do